jgi:hypothetical protein
MNVFYNESGEIMSAECFRKGEMPTEDTYIEVDDSLKKTIHHYRVENDKLVKKSDEEISEILEMESLNETALLE